MDAYLNLGLLSGSLSGSRSRLLGLGLLGSGSRGRLSGRGLSRPDVLDDGSDSDSLSRSRHYE
jgi:hypothetical protein